MRVAEVLVSASAPFGDACFSCALWYLQVIVGCVSLSGPHVCFSVSESQGSSLCCWGVPQVVGRMHLVAGHVMCGVWHVPHSDWCATATGA